MVKLFPKNRRGDIPTILLVIGTLAVCTLALFNFNLSTNHLRTSFVGVGMMEQLNSQIENKTFYSEDTAGLYVEKNITEGILWWEKKSLLFSAEFNGDE